MNGRGRRRLYKYASFQSSRFNSEDDDDDEDGDIDAYLLNRDEWKLEKYFLGK